MLQYAIMYDYDQEFNSEKLHADSVVEQVKKYRELLEKTLNYMGSENLRKLQDLRDNAEANPTDLFMFIEQLHAQNLAFNFKEKFKQLEELSYLMNEPYFSRIDLMNQSTDHKDTIYIGRFGLSTPDSDLPTITDWRAKIASVYYKYRYPQKNVSYDTEDGTVTRDLDLKRTYEFDTGELLKFFNNDLQLDENEIIQEKISKRTGGVLEDIVSTIQESQMKIIEEDPRGVCIVQGCAGSGKSTVAIHKMSHIFFNYPNLIRPQNSMLIARSQILVGYLSVLFPKLGIFDINYGTLKDMIIRIIFAHDIHITTELDDERGMELVNRELIDRLNEVTAEVKRSVGAQVSKIEANPLYGSYFTFVNDEEISAHENVLSVVEDLEEEIKYQKERLDEGVAGVAEARCQENMKNLKKLVKDIRKISNNLRTTEFPALLKEFGIKPKDKLNYRDSLIYIYLYSQIFGLPEFKKFEYCVVDEGQDFSYLEYLVLNKLVLKGRFCILGDLNQSYLKTGLSSWDAVEHVITEAKECRRFDLTTNYRSTKPIIEYAVDLISTFSKEYLPQSINRIGDPVLERCEKPEDRINELTKELSAQAKDLDKSIGIICYQQEDFNILKDYLETHLRSKLNEHLVILNPKDRIFYTPKGIYLTMFENCKGLEFAKVYILGMNKKAKDLHEAKMNYVSATRAMNELVVYPN